MIVRRPARLALVAALPFLAVAACGSEPRQPRQDNTTANAETSAAADLRRSIETASFRPRPTPSVTDGSDQQGSGGSGSTPAPDGGDASADGAGNVAGALPEDARADPAMVRAQILLDRSRFSPGIIDGLGGENTRQAIAAFEEANDLTVDGELDETVFQRLSSGDGGQVLTDYTLTESDVAGPFIGSVPDSMEAMGRLDSVGYATAREAVAEKFHMSEALLSALNPGVDFSRAGQTLVVAATGPAELEGEVARIVIDKDELSVRAFDDDGQLLAFYPATIGSRETPSPSGTHTVRAIAPDPNYTYDPDQGGGGKIIVPPGPNNPVGSVWIDLSRDGYGIHGTPDPALIGKTASSGCVRLTNWDAEHLAAGVSSGVTVEFR
ncbi:L,D-transpeptidase [Brevundimonas sp. R86498]|uniref:L,D-transpeptidase n=1 Tax=Brevundimonas sp. R86498 TaxID=3093845 RepID=UPI0037C4F7FD